MAKHPSHRHSAQVVASHMLSQVTLKVGAK